MDIIPITIMVSIFFVNSGFRWFCIKFSSSIATVYSVETVLSRPFCDWCIIPPMPINLHFDFLAPIYDRVISEREPEEFVKLLDLPIDGILLDVGGGTGRASLGLKPHVSQLLITDLSGPMLARAQEKGHENLLLCSSNTLCLVDNSVDRIMVVDALHHFSDQAGAVCELLRVLKPGGLPLIAAPDAPHSSV